jgi:hypothetical protein
MTSSWYVPYLQDKQYNMVRHLVEKAKDLGLAIDDNVSRNPGLEIYLNKMKSSAEVHSLVSS